MAIVSRHLHATVASQMEIMGQDLAETSAVLRRFADAFQALSIEAKLAGIINDRALNDACEQAREDLDRIAKR